jgi:hypothetical protein
MAETETSNFQSIVMNQEDVQLLELRYFKKTGRQKKSQLLNAVEQLTKKMMTAQIR